MACRAAEEARLEAKAKAAKAKAEAKERETKAAAGVMCWQPACSARKGCE